jgi:3-hexulose-6-phosphate synthase/6-phospho-3-hexuloisomerase
VEAIDLAQPGDVLVIDAGGVGPAIWGELATHSAIQRGLNGVVIDGAIRDSGDIVKLGFPAFSRLVMPNAGEPKGFGEIGVPIRIGNQKVEPGDWLLGDDDGVTVLPRKIAVEYANRAMDVLEKENRIREEIKEGRTLAQVTDLLRWEKKV